MHRTVALGFWVWPLMHLPPSPSLWGWVALAMPLLEHGWASGMGRLEGQVEAGTVTAP